MYRIGLAHGGCHNVAIKVDAVMAYLLGHNVDEAADSRRT
jgi:hypothetical protein